MANSTNRLGAEGQPTGLAESAPGVRGMAKAIGIEDADTRFELRRVLGDGGMGVVYEAYDREREQVVAVKVLRQLEASAISRFKREFRSLARVIHPNLVRLYELLSVNDRWLYTMELIDGQSLVEYVRGVAPRRGVGPALRSDASLIDVLAASDDVTAATGDMLSTQVAGLEAPRLAGDLPKLREAMGQLVIAVDALHRTGHLHRDLKPSNVLVAADGRLVLLDFGIIAELGAQEVEVIGTPTYMAPEQFVSGATHTPATDWYAVGCVLYTLVSGVRPFAGSPRDISYAKQNITPASLQELFPALDPVLSELCAALMDRDPGVRPAAHEVYRALVGRELNDEIEVRSLNRMQTSLIGRHRQLDVLRSALTRTEQHSATCVMVRGRSGMGKSALVRTFLEEARQFHNALILEGRCYERESVPYKGVDGIVEMLAKHLSSLPPNEIAALVPKEIASLERVFSVLGEVSEFLAARSVAAPCPAEPLEIRRRAFAALRGLLVGLGKKRPLILVLDDLQWSDSATESFLFSLANCELPSVMFIGCYREEVQPNAVLTAILESEHQEPIRVGRLSLPNASRLAEELLAKQGTENFALARQIARESGGMPFLLEELVRYSKGRTDTAQLGGKHGLSADRVILARVGGLPAVAQTLLELVSLSGQPIRRRVLAQASDCGPQLFEALANLEDANLVSSSGTGDHDFVETYHDRVRESVASSLTLERANQHHLSLAMVMELGPDASHEDSLRHFAAAGVMDRAAEHAIEAGDAAARTLAFKRAAHCYRLALAYHTTADPTELEVKLAEALLNSGRALEAADHFFEASKSASGVTARTLKARAAAEYLRGGAIDTGTELAHEASGERGAAVRSPIRTIAGLLLKRAHIRLRGYGFKQRLASEISADLLSQIDASWHAASVFSAVDPIRGVDLQARHMLLSLKVGEPTRVSQALLAEALFVALGGAAFEAKANALVERSLQIDEDPTPSIVGWRGALRGTIAYQSGHWKEARRYALESMELVGAQCAGMQWETSSMQLTNLWSLYYLGELGELEQRRCEYLRHARERGDLYGSVSLSVGLLTSGLIAQGRTAEAREGVRWALQSWTAQGFHLQHLWGAFAKSQCDLYDGEPEEAFLRMESVWKAASRAHLLGVQALRAELLHLRGCVALACLARATSRDSDKRAVAVLVERKLRKEGVPWITGLADAILAGLNALDGDTEAAAGALRSAANGFAAADMALFAATALWTRATLSDDREPGEPDARSAREQMIALGATEPERIAPLFVPQVRLTR